MKTSNLSAGLILAATALLMPLSASAQSMFGYQVLVDADADSATGCSVTPTGGATLAGFEHRLLIDVEVGGSAEVTSLQQQDCSGVSFSAPVVITSPASPPWPVGLDLGAGGADAVEAGVLREAVGAGFSPAVRLAFVADDGAGSDVLATTDGSAGGESILLGLPLDPVQIPAFSLFGLVLLLLAVVGLGWLATRRLGRIGTMSVVLLVAGLAWAMNFMLDGAVTDWNGVPPAGQDPTGDATDGASGNDLVAGFAAFENGALYFRIDVADVENQSPDAGDDAYSTDEDMPLNIGAPGVLSNDSDAELDPITAVLDAGPTNAQSFTLNADGSFDYTPNADFNGGDSFTYFANDGQANSAAATVTITVNAINDPPVAVGDSATVSEDDPATAIDVLANDTDIDGGPISIGSATQPADGTVVITGGGTGLTYQPDPDFCNDGSPTDNFTYTLTPGGSIATVAVTVTCENDPPVVAFPTAGVNFDPNVGPVNVDPAATFDDPDSTDLDTGDLVVDITANCTAMDTIAIENQGIAAGQIGVSGAEVTFEGTIIGTFAQDTTCPPDATPALRADFNAAATPAAAEALLRAILFSTTAGDTNPRTVDAIANDGDGGVSNTATQTINSDAAPTATSPTDNETRFDPAANITVDFSENVDLAVGAFALECDLATVAFTPTPAVPANSVNMVVLDPDTDLDPGAMCTVTVAAASVTDVDTIDPPDNMAADAVFGFAVEAPPQVDSVMPASGSTDIEPGADVVVGFDEPVTLNGNWFTLQCGATTFSPGNANVTVTSNDGTNTQVTLDPDTDFGFGDSCVLDVFADTTNGVTDQDSVDDAGLDTLDGNGDGTGGDNFQATFDVEAAPQVTATAPADTATDVAGNTDIVLDFSEPVSAAAASFDLDCPSAMNVSLTATANGAQDQYTLDPDTDLPAGETCTVTVVAASISDVDSIDPPDNLDGDGDGTTGDDLVFSFTIDQAPELTAVQAEVADTLTNVSDGTTLGEVDDDTTVVFGFSEPVNVTNDGVSLSCTGSGTLATPATLTVAGNSTDTITLTRASGTFSGGETCTLGFNLTEINDTDANDPPDNLAPVTGSFAFEIAPVVEDDARTVTAHLQAAYTDATAGGNDDHLLLNDNCAGCTLTFGETDATANSAGSTATFTDGAIVTVDSDGTFTYNPPPGITGTTDTFVYRLTTLAGEFDEATVTMTIDGPVIWYVDADATGAVFNGTAAFPFDDLAVSTNGFDANAADAPGQTIFVYDSASDNSSVQCGLTLLNSQVVIGEGEAAGTLNALTGRAPVAETVFAPDTTGAHPQLSSSGDCLTLGSGNTARGLDIGDTTGGHAFADGGATTGTATITDIGVTGVGGIISISNGGTLNAGFNETSATSAPDTEIELVNVTGTLDSAGGAIAHSDAASGSVSISGGAIGGNIAASFNQTAGNSPLLWVQGGHTGSLTFSGSMSASAGTGLQFDNADGTYNLQGTVSITSGSAGLNVVNGSAGTLNMTNTGSVIQGIQGIPFRVNNSTMAIDYDGDITQRQAVGSLLSARVIEIVSGTGTISLDGDVVAGNNSVGDQVTGDAVFLSNTGSVNPIRFNSVDLIMRDAPAFVSQTSGNVAMNRLRVRCDGNLNVSGDTHCVQISDTASSGFTIEAIDSSLNNPGDFGGALSLNDTTGTWTVEDISGGLSGLNETIVFGRNFGTLNIATVNSATSPGGLATGGISGANQPAFDLENGAINISALSVSAAPSGGGTLTTGIRLVNTTGAGFEVTGDGSTAGSGGTIQTTTGNGVQLANSGNIELNFIDITNSNANGIFGNGVTNFVLNGANVTDNGDEVNEGGLRFDNLLGTATISGTTISGSAEHNIEITNTSGVLNSLTVSDSTIATNSSALGSDGLLLETRNSAQANVVVTGSIFDDNQSDGIQISAINDSAASLTVNDTTFTSTLDGSTFGSVAARGIVLSASTNATLDFDIGTTTSNLFENFSPNIGEEAINVTLVSTSTASALMSGRINNNTFTNSGGAVGIDVRGDGALVMEIDGNIANTSRQAIDVITGDAVGDAATVDLTITNNSLTVAGTGANPNNEAIGWLGDRDTVSCLNVRSNTGVASGTRPDFLIDDFTTAGGSVDIESGPTDCGGAACGTSTAHLLTNNTITDAISGAGLVPVGTCVTVP